MPRKYVPIPEDQKKKRGPKPKENKLFADPFSETVTVEPTPEPTPETPPQVEPVEPIKAPDAVIETFPQVTPEPTPQVESEPIKNNFIASDVPSELDGIISDYSQGAPQSASEPTSVERIEAAHGVTPVPQTTTAPKISLVRGYMILLVLDFVLPMGITFMLRKTNNPKFNKLTARDIKLSDAEFDDLEPVADEVAKDVQLNLSPMTQLFLGMAIIYGGKILTLEK